VFLKVLEQNNEIGEWLFHRFYKKHKPQKLFRFLDEESTVLEELQIIASLYSKAFINAARKIMKRDYFS
jgi:lycopene beta-cyclase